MAELRGKIGTSKPAISGKIQGQISASFKPLENVPQTYTGSYEIDPLKTAQVLPTKDKLMVDDLTVQGIYYYEVTNDTGGSTVTIGRD